MLLMARAVINPVVDPKAKRDQNTLLVVQLLVHVKKEAAENLGAKKAQKRGMKEWK